MTTPRYFLRRLFAFFVDFLIINIISTLVLLPLVHNNTDNFRLSGLLHSTLCYKISQASQSLHDLVAPSIITGGALCEEKENFVANGHSLTLVLDRQTSQNGNVQHSSYKQITFPVNAKGNIVKPLFLQGILDWVLLALGSVFFLTRWQGKTPGKALLGLRVTGLTKGAALRREAMRVAPMLIAHLFVFLPVETAASLLQNITLFIVGIGLVSLFFGWYYLWPFIRWNGQSRHDRFAATKVERA